MYNDYNTLMQGKSEEELRKYIINGSRYQQEAIDAAIIELKNRGLSISESEMQTLDAEIELKTNRNNSTSHFAFNNDNIVTDTEAPLFYTQKAIWVFSVLFSAFTGTILLLSNIKRSGKKEGYWPVLIFGIIYITFTLVVVNIINEHIKPTPFIAFIFGGIGAIVLNKFFWKKYLSDTQYRKRPVWKPAIICISICILLILISILGTSPSE